MQRRTDEDKTINKNRIQRDRSVQQRQQGPTRAEDREGWSEQYTPYAPKREYRSKYQEFMAGEWRYAKNEINITENTVIPPIPAELLQVPNDVEYHSKQLEFTEKIDELYAELKDYQQEQRTKQRDK